MLALNFKIEFLSSIRESNKEVLIKIEADYSRTGMKFSILRFQLGDGAFAYGSFRHPGVSANLTNQYLIEKQPVK